MQPGAKEALEEADAKFVELYEQMDEWLTKNGDNPSIRKVRDALRSYLDGEITVDEMMTRMLK